jgi:hypothetical protein
MHEQVLESVTISTASQDCSIDLAAAFHESHVQEVLDKLDQEQGLPLLAYSAPLILSISLCN